MDYGFMIKLKTGIINRYLFLDIIAFSFERHRVYTLLLLLNKRSNKFASENKLLIRDCTYLRPALRFSETFTSWRDQLMIPNHMSEIRFEEALSLTRHRLIDVQSYIKEFREIFGFREKRLNGKTKKRKTVNETFRGIDVTDH